MALALRLIGLSTLLLALAIGLLATQSGLAAAEEAIPVGDVWFCDSSFQDGVCETTITAGETVVWDLGGASLPHTTTHCGADCDNPTDLPLWDSGIIDDGGSFQFTFSEPGTYLYRCNVHPIQMRGQIVVEAPAAEPTATETAPAVDLAPIEATPTATQGPQLPDTGQGPQDGSSSWSLIAALTAVGAALAGLGAATYRRARQGR